MDKNIIEFLVKAKKTTFAGGAAISADPSRPNSKILQYAEGDLKYIDTYLGSINFAGEEALWKDDVPFWSMNYIGKPLFEDIPVEELWKFLSEALLLVPEEYPFRGPLQYENGDFVYKCSIKGDFLWFWGLEEIYFKGDKVYECMFHGGDVK